MKFGIISFSHIIGCLDLTEDLKEQIFRYENRFQIFFLRLIEVVCHAIKLGFEGDLCKKSIAGCLKNLFVLLTQFGSGKGTLNVIISRNRQETGRDRMSQIEFRDRTVPKWTDSFSEMSEFFVSRNFSYETVPQIFSPVPTVPRLSRGCPTAVPTVPRLSSSVPQLSRGFDTAKIEKNINFKNLNLKYQVTN